MPMRNLIILCLLSVSANLDADTVFDTIKDDPNLPRVLLIGDSISIGYTIPTRNRLAGKVNLHRIPVNEMFTVNGLAHIKEWIGEGKWDVIHFNWGIWDTHLLGDDGTILTAEDEANGRTGKLRTNIPEYKKNLSNLIDIMLASGAKLIWASSTPVTCRSKEHSGDIARYNMAASIVMAQKGIIINDLYHYIKPHLKEMQTDDGCHFLPTGDEYLGKKVAESIISALNMEKWQPDNFKAVPVGSQTIAGRNVVRYEHNCLKRWGYNSSQNQYFYVVEPKVRSGNPLMVCLHSAGGTGESEMPSNVERIAKAGDEFAGLILNSGDGSEWWWGEHEIKAHEDAYKTRLTPVEVRVLDTVEWATRRYDIDRNRIYLHGISMGGSGTLGIGMPNGDIFAAILAGVPAGTKHSLHRLSNPSVKIYQAAIIESTPPVYVFFSQKDDWSKEMEEWLDFTSRNRMSVSAAWGPWGHENHYEMTNPAVYEFPWLNITKNQAYPAFTNASSDDRYPGFLSDGEDKNGQMNGYFRWKVLEDKPDSFTIEIRLVNGNELSVPVEVPAESICDVTIRRFQQFVADNIDIIKWQIEQGGLVINTGTVIPDGVLVTVKCVKVTSEPIRLKITKSDSVNTPHTL